MQKKTWIKVVLSLLLVIMLIGCGIDQVHLGKLKIGEIRIGMYGEAHPGHMAYHFRTFNGFESVDMVMDRQGILELTINVELDKGNLTLSIENPAGEVIWEMRISQISQEQLEIPMVSAGTYRLIAEAEMAGGWFELDWQIR